MKTGSSRKIIRRSGVSAPIMVLGAAALGFALAATSRGQAPQPVVNSPTPPADVSVPPNFPGNPIAFFDDYSWRVFIALVWPAEKNQRGAPDTTKSVSDAGPRVFETYKSLNEVFHNDGSKPVAWDSFDPPKYNPCGLQEKWGDLTLGSFSKFSKVMPASDPYPMSRVLSPPTAPPFNVVRQKPIHSSTRDTNDAYHGALPRDSVWQNYQLVMTQWPITPNRPELPGTPNNTFPGATPNDATAFSNVTLETFDQTNIRFGCMACHNITKQPTDFVWSLNDHAFPANPATPNIMRNPALRELRNLIIERKSFP